MAQLCIIPSMVVLDAPNQITQRVMFLFLTAVQIAWVRALTCCVIVPVVRQPPVGALDGSAVRRAVQGEAEADRQGVV